MKNFEASFFIQVCYSIHVSVCVVRYSHDYRFPQSPPSV